AEFRPGTSALVAALSNHHGPHGAPPASFAPHSPFTANDEPMEPTMIRTLLATTALAALLATGAIAQDAAPAAPAATEAPAAAPAEPMAPAADAAARADVESGAMEETDIHEPWD